MLTATEIANLKSAADRIDAEVQTWYEGIGVYNEKKKAWHIPEDTDESLKIRVMRLENSAQFLRQLRLKALKNIAPDYQI